MRAASRQRRRRLTFLSVIGFLLSLGATTFYLDDYADSGQLRLAERLRKDDDRQKRQNSHIRDADVLQFRADGEADFRWQAEQVIRRGGRSPVQLINLKYARESEAQGSWQAKAARGTLSPGGNVLELEEAVELYNTRQHITVQTDSLRIDTLREIVTTDAPVVILHEGGETKARGLEVKLQEQTLYLKNEVRGEYQSREDSRAG